MCRQTTFLDFLDCNFLFKVSLLTIVFNFFSIRQISTIFFQLVKFSVFFNFFSHLFLICNFFSIQFIFRFPTYFSKFSVWSFCHIQKIRLFSKIVTLFQFWVHFFFILLMLMVQIIFSHKNQIFQISSIFPFHCCPYFNIEGCKIG